MNNRLKGRALAFGMLIGFLILMSISAKSQDLGLASGTYIYNDTEVSGDVRLIIYDWEYWVISVGELQDTIPYNTIQEYRAKGRKTLRHIIVPEESPIDSMSFGWESNGYIKYKDGSTYEFPVLYKIKKRHL